MKKSVFVISCALGLIVGLLLGVLAGEVGHSFGEISQGEIFKSATIAVNGNQLIKAGFNAGDGVLSGRLAGKESDIKYGVMGYSTTIESNTAAVYGIRDGTAWGALGYKNDAGTIYGVYGSGGTYAGYFDGDVKVKGELDVGEKLNVEEIYLSHYTGDVIISSPSGTCLIEEEGIIKYARGENTVGQIYVCKHYGSGNYQWYQLDTTVV